MAMDFKHRLIFWLAAGYTLLLLLTGPQMLVVEGLECEVCVRLGEEPGFPCRRMPCNTQEDVEKSTAKYMKDGIMVAVIASLKGRENTENTPPQSQAQDTADTDTEDMTSTPSTVSFTKGVCVLVKGFIRPTPNNPVMPSSFKNGVNLAVTRCLPLNDTRPPRAEPYDDLQLPEVSETPNKNSPKPEHQVWHVCDEKNEADCRMPEDLAANIITSSSFDSIPSPPDDDLDRSSWPTHSGLDCEICFRIENLGRCNRMPCNTPEDAKKSQNMFVSNPEETGIKLSQHYFIDAIKNRLSQGETNNAARRRRKRQTKDADPPRMNCLKSVGTYVYDIMDLGEVSYNFIQVMCLPFGSNDKTPRREPYTPDELSLKDRDNGNGKIKFHSVYICDKNNEEVCRVADKLSSGIKNKTPSFLYLITIICCCLLAGLWN